jgi:hypothetical protein
MLDKGIQESSLVPEFGDNGVAESGDSVCRRMPESTGDWSTAEAIQPFSHSAIQPFSHSAIQPFSHSAIQPFSHSAIRGRLAI